MIPDTFVLEPGLRLHSVYNGYWYWSRPSIAELKQDLRGVIEGRPGQFAVKASPLALAWPGRRVHAKTEARVNEAFVLGSQRTRPDRKFDRGRGRMR